MNDTISKPGRKPEFGTRALTAVEKTQRQRKKRQLLEKAMAEHGYLPAPLFIAPAHLKFLALVERKYGGVTVADQQPYKLSAWVWRLIKRYARELEGELNLENPTDKEILHLIKSDKWPQYSLHESADMDARVYFDRWSTETFGKAEGGGDGIESPA
jgi:hypothetical protein